MPFKVRQAGPADAAGLVALSNRVAADAPYFLAYDVDPASGADILQAKLAREAGNAGRVFIAEQHGHLQGALLARAHAHPAFDGVIPNGLSVDPNHHRDGVGRALLSAVIDWARARKLRRIQLAVIATNAAALALFKNIGFAAEGALRRAAEINGVRHDVIPMGLLLN